MGLFDFLKKQKDAEDTDSFVYKMMNMDKGSIFDYDMKSWVVEEVYEYRWQNGGGAVEYLVDSGEEKLFLSVEDDDGIEISLSHKVKIGSVDPALSGLIERTEQPPATIVFDGTQFMLDAESVGMFRDCGGGDWEDLISWDYYDKDEKQILSIEQWGENDFDASAGIVIEEYQITNILPAPNR